MIGAADWSFSPGEHDDSLRERVKYVAGRDWRHDGVPIDAVSGREFEVSAEEFGLRRRTP